MGAYIYCIQEDFVYKSSIKERTFNNEWFKLDSDGTATVKGSNRQGYAWDGCSPKLKILDIYFGTPEGVLNFKTGRSKTYYASLIHDAFYQFSKGIKPFIMRREVDKEFYFILKENKFKPARLYYWSVRIFGWTYWLAFRRSFKG
ncbi:MAG: hypothetical protein V2A72_00050 [Candidatus Omnitrophota bacterium]